MFIVISAKLNSISAWRLYFILIQLRKMALQPELVYCMLLAGTPSLLLLSYLNVDFRNSAISSAAGAKKQVETRIAHAIEQRGTQLA